jgi:hypothetical protein
MSIQQLQRLLESCNAPGFFGMLESFLCRESQCERWKSIAVPFGQLRDCNAGHGKRLPESGSVTQMVAAKSNPANQKPADKQAGCQKAISP